MVLVDTSVWIDFLRQGNERLKILLEDGEVATHPLVIGELHVGNISRRKQFLRLLEDLPRIEECSHSEVLYFIEERKLHGKGIGYFDAHILCSAIIYETPLWTLDKRLDNFARALTSQWS
jgi:predicted nucleic acid-binding protein